MATVTGTTGPDTLFFQGNLEQLTLTLVNPYSGETILIDEEKNVNQASYDGLGGTDTLLLTNFGDALFLDDGAGNALVTSIENVLAGNGGDLIIFSSPTLTYGNVLLDGGSENDIIWGNVGNDILNGKAGDDRLDGGPGSDTLRGGDNDDILHGGDGVDSVNGDTGNDTLYGDAGNDPLSGGDGNDTLIGGSGDDRLNGGNDTDTASWHTSPAAVTADLVAGTASDGFGGTDTLLNIENLTGSDFNDILMGDGFANVLNGIAGDDQLDGREGDDSLLGGGGNDTLMGGLGNDMLDGGADIDTADYAGSTGPVTADLVTGTAVDGMGGTDTLLNIENVIGSAMGDALAGDDADNALEGRAGDDLLNGRGGDDALLGGDGNDSLTGGAGNDMLDGGADIDTADYATSTGPVTADLLAGTADDGMGGTDTLLNIENLTGSDINDSLSGDNADNAIHGGAGDDLLVGRGGNDVLEGGAGNDTADYAASTSNITADLGTGTADDGMGGTDALLTIENLTGSDFDDTLSGDGADNILTGAGGADLLTGKDGNDALLGGGGNDTLMGGLGNDMLDGGADIDTADYAGSTGPVAADLVTGTADDGMGGTDTLLTIENLAGSEMNDTLSGDSGINRIEGRGGADILDGRENDDALLGGDGTDTVYGGAGNDTIEGGEGDDILFGGTGGDDSAFVTTTTQAHEFSSDVVLPKLVETRKLNAPDTLGIAQGDLSPGFETTATIKFVESKAGYNNSLGHYTIGADGTITGVEMDFASIKSTAAGTEKTVAVSGEPGSSLGLFVLSNGFNANHGYGNLDMGSGHLKFVYKFGTSAERPANISDAPNKVSLVYDDGVREFVLKGDVFHTSDRGGDEGLNKDGKVHVVSGLIDETPVDLNPVAKDIKGKMSSLTKDGITVSVGDPLVSSLKAGTLSWVNGSNGEGIGIKSNGNNKIWKPGEVISVDLAQDASKVVVTLADIDCRDRHDGIDFKLYLAGQSAPVVGEIDLGTLDPVKGVVRVTFDAADFGGPDALISGIDLFSMVGSSGLGAASFLLNNVQVFHPSDAIDDGTLRIGFEDLRNIGDGDYNDVVVDVKIAGHTGTETVNVADNDAIDGGAGDDMINGGYGNDVLLGGDGNDTLHGGQGADILNGGAGADDLYGGSGVDTFMLSTLDGMVDTIHDFAKGTGGDILNLSNLLDGFDPLVNALDHFVRLVDAGGGDTAVQVSHDGAAAFETVATLLGGVGGASAADLLADGNLVVAATV